MGSTPDVIRYVEIDATEVNTLLDRYGLSVRVVAPGETIVGSYWGDEEAGLVEDTLYVRPDTPVHSLLHEACHYVCMDADRRTGLHTDAGGDYDEENGVCYLQILLADEISHVGSGRMMKDMDLWGYTFRLGSALDWFEQDAEDALEWLRRRGLVDARRRPTFRLR